MTILPIRQGYTTCYAVTGERTVLIDTAGPGHEQGIMHACAAHGIRPHDISLIIITHGHTDHSGCAAAIQRMCGAPVAAHAADSPFIGKGVNPPIATTSRVSAMVKELIDGRASRPIEPCAVDIDLRDGMSLSAWGIDARVVHTPGHTQGSVSVVCACAEAIVGDALMGKMINMRTPRWPFFGDDLPQAMRSMRALLDLPVEKFHASHGGPFSRKSVERLVRESPTDMSAR